MDEKPKIDLDQYRSTKIKGRYALKFVLYILIFVALWFWYQQIEHKKKLRKPAPIEKVKNPKEVDLDKIVIEP
jgi:flagellar biosynthesis/type III secretory pathway M-ring protein FliF/YscJ